MRFHSKAALQGGPALAVCLFVFLLSVAAGGCRQTRLGGDAGGEECLISQAEAEPLEGRHILLRPGGPDIDNPSADVSGSTVAVAFQEMQWLDYYHFTASLKVGSALIDAGGSIGEFRFEVVREAADTRFFPVVRAADSGFILLWIEDLYDYHYRWYDGGSLYRTRLDRDGRPTEGPYEEDLGPCLWIDAASSDSLAMACVGPEGDTLAVATAGESGPSRPPLDLDECDEGISPPAVVWDGEAFDVIYVCGRVDLDDQLKMARITQTGELMAGDIVLDEAARYTDYWPSAPGAMWNGSEIVLLWFRRGADLTQDSTFFATVSRQGELLGAPVIVEMNPRGHEFPMWLDVVPFGHGYLVLGSFCLAGDEAFEGGTGVCPLEPDGSQPAACVHNVRPICMESGMPLGVTMAHNAGEALIFYEESFWIAGYEENSSIFGISVEPSPFRITEPMPLITLVSDMRPMHLHCEGRVCRVFGEQDLSGYFGPVEEPHQYAWYSADVEEGGVETTPAPALTDATWAAQGSAAGGVGVLSRNDEGDAPAFNLVKTDGSISWTADLSGLVDAATPISAYSEDEGFRLFYRCPGNEETCHSFLAEGLLGESASLGDEVDLKVGRNGVYFGSAETAGGEENSYSIYRFRPDEDDGFTFFAEWVSSGPLSALRSKIFPADGVIGVAEWNDAGAMLHRWDPDGSRYADCRLESDEDLWLFSQWCSSAAELAMATYDPGNASNPLLLWKVGLSGSGSLYSLLRPDNEKGLRFLHVDCAQDGLHAAWMEEGTGNVYLSVWPI